MINLRSSTELKGTSYTTTTQLRSSNLDFRAPPGSNFLGNIGESLEFNEDVDDSVLHEEAEKSEDVESGVER